MRDRSTLADRLRRWRGRLRVTGAAVALATVATVPAVPTVLAPASAVVTAVPVASTGVSGVRTPATTARAAQPRPAASGRVVSCPAPGEVIVAHPPLSAAVAGDDGPAVGVAGVTEPHGHSVERTTMALQRDDDGRELCATEAILTSTPDETGPTRAPPSTAVA